jgi:hypothetical protein
MTEQEILNCTIPSGKHSDALIHLRRLINDRVNGNLVVPNQIVLDLCASFEALYRLATGKLVLPEGDEISWNGTAAAFLKDAWIKFGKGEMLGDVFTIMDEISPPDFYKNGLHDIDCKCYVCELKRRLLRLARKEIMDELNKPEAKK